MQPERAVFLKVHSRRRPRPRPAPSLTAHRPPERRPLLPAPFVVGKGSLCTSVPFFHLSDHIFTVPFLYLDMFWYRNSYHWWRLPTGFSQDNNRLYRRRPEAAGCAVQTGHVVAPPPWVCAGAPCEVHTAQESPRGAFPEHVPIIK